MIPAGYILGLGRDFPHPKTSHLYKLEGDPKFNEPGLPMCLRGWNRHNGSSYSIWRGQAGSNICAVCLRRARAGKGGVQPKHFDGPGWSVGI